MLPTLALLTLGWLVSTRLGRAGSTESAVPAIAFAVVMLLLLYTNQFK